MTANQAHKEAQRRWGKNAMVKDTGKRCTCGHKACAWLHARYSVGKVELGLFFAVKGQGATWEKAFAKATEAEEADKARHERYAKERENT
jgi:hypothetical protein